MSDILIREVPDEVLAVLDAHAARLGVSRSEYIRRRLSQDAARSTSSVNVTDLQRFATVFQDLTDTEVMARAWE